jgi:hypothetical protein
LDDFLVFLSMKEEEKEKDDATPVIELMPLPAAGALSSLSTPARDATPPTSPSAPDDGSVKGDVLVVSVPSSSSISGHSITIPSALLSDASFLFF